MSCVALAMMSLLHFVSWEMVDWFARNMRMKFCVHLHFCSILLPWCVTLKTMLGFVITMLEWVYWCASCLFWRTFMHEQKWMLSFLLHDSGWVCWVIENGHWILVNLALMNDSMLSILNSGNFFLNSKWWRWQVCCNFVKPTLSRKLPWLCCFAVS